MSVVILIKANGKETVAFKSDNNAPNTAKTLKLWVLPF